MPHVPELAALSCSLGGCHGSPPKEQNPPASGNLPASERDLRPLLRLTHKCPRPAWAQSLHQADTGPFSISGALQCEADGATGHRRGSPGCRHCVLGWGQGIRTAWPVTGIAPIHLTHQNPAASCHRSGPDAALQGRASEEEKQDSHPHPSSRSAVEALPGHKHGVTTGVDSSAPKALLFLPAIRAASLGAPHTPSGPPCMACPLVPTPLPSSTSGALQGHEAAPGHLSKAWTSRPPAPPERPGLCAFCAWGSWWRGWAGGNS